MKRSNSRIFILAALVAAVTIAFTSSARATQVPTVDKTQQFISAGARIEGLQVTAVEGIIVIRGHTSDSSKAEEVSRIAKKLGYKRVANLIQVVGPIDDAAIRREAERQLTMNRSLDGCQLQVASEKGVVSVSGR